MVRWLARVPRTLNDTGIWQSGDLVYRQLSFSRVWTGQSNLTTVGTVASTCGNFADTTQTAGQHGAHPSIDTRWWNFTTAACNNTGTGVGGLYCVEP